MSISSLTNTTIATAHTILTWHNPDRRKRGLYCIVTVSLYTDVWRESVAARTISTTRAPWVTSTTWGTTRRGSTLRGPASSSSTTARPTCPASRGPTLCSTATGGRHPPSTTELPTRYLYRDKTVTTGPLTLHTLHPHRLLLLLLPWLQLLLQQLHLWLLQHQLLLPLLQPVAELHLHRPPQPPEVPSPNPRVQSQSPAWPRLYKPQSSKRLTESRLPLLLAQRTGVPGRKDQLRLWWAWCDFLLQWPRHCG